MSGTFPGFESLKATVQWLDETFAIIEDEEKVRAFYEDEEAFNAACQAADDRLSPVVRAIESIFWTADDSWKV